MLDDYIIDREFEPRLDPDDEDERDDEDLAPTPWPRCPVCAEFVGRAFTPIEHRACPTHGRTAGVYGTREAILRRAKGALA